MILEKHVNVTALVLHDFKIRRSIHCDQCYFTDELFDEYIKPISRPPFSEYSISMMLLEAFAVFMQKNRDRFAGQNYCDFNFNLIVDEKHVNFKVLVTTSIQDNLRVLTFSKAKSVQ